MKEITLNDFLKLIKKYNYKILIIPAIAIIATLLVFHNTRQIFEGSAGIKIGQLKAFNDRPLDFVFEPQKNIHLLVSPDSFISELHATQATDKIIKSKELELFSKDFRNDYFNDTFTFNVNRTENIIEIKIRSYSQVLTNKLCKKIISYMKMKLQNDFDTKIKSIKNEIVFYDQIISSLKKEHSASRNIVEEFIKFQKLQSAEEKRNILKLTLDSDLTFASHQVGEIILTKSPALNKKWLMLVLVFVTSFIFNLTFVFIYDTKLFSKMKMSFEN